MENIEADRKRKLLNVEGKNRSLWLVKVPVFVAEKWSKRSNDDILGNMRIVGNDNNTKQTCITLLGFRRRIYT